MNSFARDKDLLDERKLFVILIDLEFYQGADLLSRCLTGSDVSEVMNNRRNLLTDSFLNKCDCVGRKGFAERRLTPGQVIQATGYKVAYPLVKPFVAKRALQTALQKIQDLFE